MTSALFKTIGIKLAICYELKDEINFNRFACIEYATTSDQLLRIAHSFFKKLSSDSYYLSASQLKRVSEKFVDFNNTVAAQSSTAQCQIHFLEKFNLLIRMYEVITQLNVFYKNSKDIEKNRLLRQLEMNAYTLTSNLRTHNLHVVSFSLEQTKQWLQGTLPSKDFRKAIECAISQKQADGELRPYAYLFASVLFLIMGASSNLLCYGEEITSLFLSYSILTFAMSFHAKYAPQQNLSHPDLLDITETMLKLLHCTPGQKSSFFSMPNPATAKPAANNHFVNAS